MTDQTTHPDALATPWRPVRHVGRTVYAQTGPDATRTDVFIGVMDTPELASAAVDAHNATLAVAPPDQTTPESLTDDDLDAIQQRTDAYGRTGPYGYVINNIEYQGNWVHDIHRLLAEVGRLRAALQVADEIEAERESDPVVLDLRARLAETRAENTRLHTWDGLMSLLDEHWPEDLYPTREDGGDRDLGPRIVSLLRWNARLRIRLDEARERYDAEEVIVDGNVFRRGNLPAILANYMDSSAEHAREAKALATKLAEARELARRWQRDAHQHRKIADENGARNAADILDNAAADLNTESENTR